MENVFMKVSDSWDDKMIGNEEKTLADLYTTMVSAIKIATVQCIEGRHRVVSICRKVILGGSIP